MTKLSQHLTVNRRVLERLIELADPDDSDVVLEPGCGDGRLTELLAERGCRVVAVEIDPVLAAEARRRLSRWENVDVVTADVLKLNPGDYTMVVGNPPYHISRRIIEWIATNPQPRRVVMTLQREFAQKLAAPPGGRDYLYVSIIAQMLYQVEIHDTVPPSAFKPRPRVTSCIVRMQRNGQNQLSPTQLKLLKNIFTDRRHLLGKVLRRIGIEPPQELAHKRILHLTTQEIQMILASLRG
ncbi:MAG: 16S rRNA (adenine(1518)-N(6)/adenine(1519)-N(6))-dimethyltransferase RsmA [Nitrososphaerota archaeon]|nr:16S rRNA (adenine(1518)-N(6)/adenine(1519)-N(6))-dimethyltransferase RsmA [Nitrososphaerota archaeon]